MVLRLASCDWIREHRHCLITGPCGVGKSWLACALGDKACREEFLGSLPTQPTAVRRPRACTR
jgi:DNA replication protein DnaC